MEHKHLMEAAAIQLDRVLAFFPRADAKGSVLLAVDTGMLAGAVMHVIVYKRHKASCPYSDDKNHVRIGTARKPVPISPRASRVSAARPARGRNACAASAAL
jgi:hypothetical protein